MSNRNEVKQLLRQYLIARIPFIVLQTIEVPRALELLREVALELSREHWLDQQSFFAHTLSKGAMNCAPTGAWRKMPNPSWGPGISSSAGCARNSGNTRP